MVVSVLWVRMHVYRCFNRRRERGPVKGIPAGAKGLDAGEGARPRGARLVRRGHGHHGTVGAGRGRGRTGGAGRPIQGIGIRQYWPVTIGAG
jgi:hypothetical protein